MSSFPTIETPLITSEIPLPPSYSEITILHRTRVKPSTVEAVARSANKFAVDLKKPTRFNGQMQALSILINSRTRTWENRSIS